MLARVTQQRSCQRCGAVLSSQQPPLTPPKDNIHQDDHRQLRHFRRAKLHESPKEPVFPPGQPASVTYFGLQEGRALIHHVTDSGTGDAAARHPAVLSFIWMLFDLEVPSPSIVSR